MNLQVHHLILALAYLHNMNKAKIIKIITNGLFGIIFFILCLYLILFILGYHPFAVKTGSMEPDIHQGSIVFVKKVKKDCTLDDFKIGDDVTYRAGKNIVTHRIIGFNEEENILLIQGINGDNPIIENVPIENIIGVAKFSMPLVGYLYLTIANKYFIIICVSLIALAFITKALSKEFKKTKEK